MSFAQEKFRSPQPFGVHVRFHATLRSPQRSLFTGDDDNAGLLVSMAEELCVLVSRITFWDFRMRSHLEVAVPAVLWNVRMGFWRFARRAATDVAGLLSFAGPKSFGPSEKCVPGANVALSIAASCDFAERRVSRRKSPAERYRDEIRNACRSRHQATYSDYRDHLHDVSVRVSRGGVRA
jgi:hypothetical protein